MPAFTRPHTESVRRVLSIIGELLPVLGTIGLLGLWLYQQTELEQRSNELRRLASARTVYQTYQSHNAVFNAIHAGLAHDEKASDEIRTAQEYNYELGLAAIERALPPSEVANIPEAPNVFSGTGDVAAKMERIQTRLEMLQDRLHEREAMLRRDANVANRKYLGWYIALSLASIAGAVCNVIAKLYTPAS